MAQPVWKNKKIIVPVAAAVVVAGAVITGMQDANTQATNSKVQSSSQQTDDPRKSTDQDYINTVKQENAEATERALANNTGHIAKTVNDVAASEPNGDLSPFDVKPETASTPAAPAPLAAPVTQPTMPPVQYTLPRHTIIKEVAVPVPTEERYNFRKDNSLIAYFAYNPANAAANMQYTGKVNQVYAAEVDAKNQAELQAVQQRLQQAAQSHVAGQQATAQGLAPGANGQQVSKAPVKALYKKGDIVGAILETGINTAKPGLMRATIAEGPLKGAILTGTFQNNGLSVSVVFTGMNLPNAPTTIPITAIAMSMKDYSTALADSVNRHIPEKLIYSFVAKFGESYAEALSNNNTSSTTRTVVDETTGQQTTISENSTTPKTTRQILRESGAEGISEALNVARDLVPKQPTVKVLPMSEIAIYFTQDLAVDERYLSN